MWRLKDDKGYPYIKINLNEDWPTVSYTRSLKDDGARYFWPFYQPLVGKANLESPGEYFPFPFL